MIAAVRVRGDVDVRREISQTMENLGLKKRNQCVVHEDSEAIRGMFKKAKDYIAYGEIDDDTLEALEERNGGEIESGDVVNLAPPSGGFRDTRKNHEQGGSIGNRGDMDSLIQKMV